MREASHLSKNELYSEHPTLIKQVNIQEMLSLHSTSLSIEHICSIYEQWTIIDLSSASKVKV